MKKSIEWLKHRLSHKLENFSLKKMKSFLKENGLAFVVIVVGWEIIEDVIFPVIFAALGNNVHPAFYAGVPASLILCFHWLAIPVLWGLWVKLKPGKDRSPVKVDCCSEDENEPTT